MCCVWSIPFVSIAVPKFLLLVVPYKKLKTEEVESKAIPYRVLFEITSAVLGFWHYSLEITFV